MIDACDKGQLAERALKLFDAMKRQGLVLNVITYNALISACDKGQQAERTLKFFEAMKRQGLLPDIIT